MKALVFLQNAVLHWVHLLLRCMAAKTLPPPCDRRRVRNHCFACIKASSASSGSEGNLTWEAHKERRERKEIAR